KEAAVPFFTEFGELAFRSGQRSRHKEVSIGYCSPFHLRAVAHEPSGKAAIHRIRVPDGDTLLHSAPYDPVRYDPRCSRRAPEQGVVDVAVIENGKSRGNDRCIPVTDFSLDVRLRNLRGPEKPCGVEIGRIHVVEL